MTKKEDKVATSGTNIGAKTTFQSTPQENMIYIYQKKNLLEDFYQVDCLHISFPNNDAFRHISKVLDPTTDIWNKDKEKKLISPNIYRLSQQDFVVFAATEKNINW